MAASDKREEAQEQEKTIPVFTVIKNNTILKNIFLLDNPPSVPDPKPFNPLKNSDQVQEFGETLPVGRHPDCNITLEHPSISRFHLRIHSKPSSHGLSVIDLSSVHATWVLGKKIEPGIRVELNEGDAVRLGSSSRVYRLRWVPGNAPWRTPLYRHQMCRFRWKKANKKEHIRQIFHTSDGGTIALDWLMSSDGDAIYRNSSISKDDTTPIMVVIPGLTSDSTSPYIKHIAFSTAKRGWNVVVSNHRGLGGISVTSNCFYNAGWTEDTREVIHYLHHEYAKAPLFAVGTSIGANILEYHGQT